MQSMTTEQCYQCSKKSPRWSAINLAEHEDSWHNSFANWLPESLASARPGPHAQDRWSSMIWASRMKGKPIKSRMHDLTAHINAVGDHRLTQGSGLPGGIMPRLISMLFRRFENRCGEHQCWIKLRLLFSRSEKDNRRECCWRRRANKG